jgi:hypothetical protein
MKKQQLNEEFKRMQQLAGIITESQLNEIGDTKRISFGPYKNVEYYTVGGENIVTLIVTNSDNFGKIENSIDFGDRDYMEDKEINYLNNEVEKLADEMSEYLTSIGIENEVLDNPIGYGQEIDNLVIEISLDDFDKLKSPKQGIGLDNLKRAGGNYLSPHIK